MDVVFDNPLIASVPFGMCAVDGEGKILGANPAFELLTGRRPAEWTGQPLAHLLEQMIADPAQALAWTVALRQALNQNLTTQLNFPADVRTESGESPVSVVGVVAPWQDRGGGQRGALLALHDLSLDPKMEGARERFLSVISHELGSPLTSIVAAADRLTKYLSDDEPEPWKLLEIIRSEAGLLQRRLGQFLGTAPAQGARHRRTRAVVTLRPLIARVVHSFEVRETGHRFVVDVPPDLPFVWGDADSIYEVLNNLVDNATRYTPAGTRITLGAKARESDVLVRVIDQGEGLSPDEVERIFDPVVQGNEEAQGAGGLGLPMCRILIRALGGDLAQGRLPSGENCVCFWLPRIEAGPGEEPQREEESDGGQDPDRRGRRGAMLSGR
jgi:signal transduction histidine kinase